MTTTAWFAALELRQEPRRDYVAYSFEFWEVVGGNNVPTLTTRKVETDGTAGTADAGSQRGAQWHTVARGDTLWGLSRRYGVALSQIIALNPDIRNPNLIYPGQKVRIK